MSICNIFKPFTEAENTIFYTFSEYTNDMVEKQHYVDSSTEIRKFVEPSGFICMKLTSNADLNNIHILLQNNYENRVCVTRDNANGTVDYKKHLLSLLYNILSNTVESGDVCYHDIDTVADSATDGMKYDEILCYLKGTDQANFTLSNSGDNYIFANNVVGGVVYPKGYEDDEDKKVTDYTGSISTGIITIDEVQKTSDAFDFDVIVVLYDYNNEIKNIPLGIYISRNPIHKVVSSNTIYGQGTSYALRICTRYACTTGTTYVNVKDITVDFDRTMETIDRMSKTIDTMNTMTSKFNDMYDIVRRSIYSHGGDISGGGSGNMDWYVWNVSK